MESDSDSDATIVSSTPPRIPTPPSKSKSKPKPKPKPSSPAPPPPSDPPFPSPDLSSLHGLPVKRIRTLPDPPTSTTTSSFSSIFKSRCPNLSFETLDKPPPTQIKIEVEKSENLQQPSKQKKSQPNFIVCSSSLPPEQPKQLRYSSEGNFVKLNINGYGRKSSFRSGKGRYPSKFKKFRRRFVRERDGNGDCGMGGELVWEEDGDGDGDDDEGLEKGGRVDGEVERAVEEVRREVSDENLVSLLKVVCGYDSFREGQMEAIKRVIGAESTMVVLPTGAGKSLCYQVNFDRVIDLSRFIVQ